MVAHKRSPSVLSLLLVAVLGVAMSACSPGPSDSPDSDSDSANNADVALLGGRIVTLD